MKIPANSITVCVSILLLTLQAVAQEDNNSDYGSGYVNFNLGESPAPIPSRQEVSLYGCNTEITTKRPNWNGEENLQWGVNNQVLTGVPYGYREKSGKRYYISKYYMASPPVFQTLKKNDTLPVNIGLVIPDNFSFFGEKPVQIVHLNYNILEPVYLSYVNVDYKYNDGINPSCDSLTVDLVPINIQCKDFRWINKYSTPAIRDALGASGIGRLRNEEKQNRVFLPSYVRDAEYLDCEITILDDILLEHEVFFATDQGLVKTLNLTDFYKYRFLQGEDIKLSCRVRLEPPAGCRKED